MYKHKKKGHFMIYTVLIIMLIMSISTLKYSIEYKKYKKTIDVNHSILTEKRYSMYKEILLSKLNTTIKKSGQSSHKYIESCDNGTILNCDNDNGKLILDKENNRILISTYFNNKKTRYDVYNISFTDNNIVLKKSHYFTGKS